MSRYRPRSWVPRNPSGPKIRVRLSQLFLAPSKIQLQTLVRRQFGNGLCLKGMLSFARPSMKTIRLLVGLARNHHRPEFGPLHQPVVTRQIEPACVVTFAARLMARCTPSLEMGAMSSAKLTPGDFVC